MSLFLPAYLALCLLARPALAVTNIASWQGLRGAQIQSKIVLEGGFISNGTWTGNKWNVDGIEQHSYGVYYQIDLTKSFNPQNDSTSDYMVPGINETTDTSRPIYVDGGMFYNDYQFFTFGGMASQAIPDGETNVLLGKVFPADPSVQRFDQGISLDQKTGNVSDNICSGAYASSPDQGLGFYFGGMVSASRSALLVNSDDNGSNHPTATSDTLIKVEWTKADTATFSYVNWPGSITPRAEGGLVWLPYGDQGVLLAIGGVEVPGDLYLTTPPRSVPTDGPFMTEIIVYDIANDAWSVQETLETEKPTQLASFCTAVIPTQDNKSYEIFVYGGYDGTYNSSDPNVKDEVWVLSVPAFQWTKVKDADSSGQHGRQGNICFTPNPTTLITIGGTDVLGSSLSSETIVDILDLSDASDLKWGGTFNASSDAAFTAPAAIVQQLGWPSDGKGPGAGAQVTGLNGTLNELFSNPYPHEVKTYYPYSSSSGNSNSAGNDNDDGNHSNHWKVPVIATLCSVIPVAIIAAVIFCCVRRRRKDEQGAQRTQQSRGKVFSWLGKSSQPIDPIPEKSQTSDNTNDTLVESHPDYFRQHGYKNTNGEIYEAPSAAASPGWGNNEAHEIMDHSQTDESSLVNRMSPTIPATTSERSGNASRFSESFPSPTRAARNAGPVPTTYELPHNRSGEHLPPAQGIQRVPVGSSSQGRPSFSDRASSPYGEQRPEHQRNLSNLSDDMQSLPSPGSEAVGSKSPTTINVSPDAPTSPPSFPRKSLPPKLEHLKE